MSKPLGEQSIRESKNLFFALLLMRFNIYPPKANLLVKEWLNQHPAENWESLKYLLNQNLVTFSEGVLKDVPQSITSLGHITKYRGTTYSMLPTGSQQLKPNSSAIKRQYRGVKY